MDYGFTIEAIPNFEMDTTRNFDAYISSISFWYDIYLPQIGFLFE